MKKSVVSSFFRGKYRDSSHHILSIPGFVYKNIEFVSECLAHQKEIDEANEGVDRTVTKLSVPMRSAGFAIKCLWSLSFLSSFQNPDIVF